MFAGAFTAMAGAAVDVLGFPNLTFTLTLRRGLIFTRVMVNVMDQVLQGTKAYEQAHSGRWQQQPVRRRRP